MSSTYVRGRLGRLASFSALFVLACAPSAWSASSESPEDFRFEITGSAWLVDSTGTIQASGTPVNLVSDLGAQQQQPTFYGQFVFKPKRKQRIVVEGTPFRISGYNVVDRSITYHGETFNVSETLRSSADLNYVFAGYQYDVLSGPLGHIGFSAGGAYVGTTGTIHAVETGVTSSKSETIGLPLAGVDARVFPIPGHRLIDLEGGVRGMAFGSYGHYLEGTVNGGVCLRSFTVLAGYRSVVADIHSSSSTPNGVDVTFKGPIFSLVWRH